MIKINLNLSGFFDINKCSHEYEGKALFYESYEIKTMDMIKALCKTLLFVLVIIFIFLIVSSAIASLIVSVGGVNMQSAIVWLIVSVICSNYIINFTLKKIKEEIKDVIK